MNKILFFVNISTPFLPECSKISGRRYEKYTQFDHPAKAGLQSDTKMILFKKAAELQQHLITTTKSGLLTGFVPTMGALHEGHLSLISRSKREAGLTVCSIFVNPTQFNDPKDFEKYPATIEKDILLLEQAACDVLFLPAVSEIYPAGFPAGHYELGTLETMLEGQYRPGHFQGVCQVMHRLLSIVNPDILLMGQKDYQQCMVVQKLLTLTGSNATLVISPTLREASGLAMSSRNMRLSEPDKEKAAAICRSLQWMKTNIHPGPTATLTSKAKEQVLAAGFEKIDYISICDATTLAIIDHWDGRTKIVALAAAFLNNVRLIDNLPFN
jgi:pantoate--beta-alanine ligase